MARDRTVLATCTALLTALLVAPPVPRRAPPVPGLAPPPDTLAVTVRPEPLLGGGRVLAGEPITLDVEAVVSRPGRFVLRRGATDLGAREWRTPARPTRLRWRLSLAAAAVGPSLELVPADGSPPLPIDVAAVVPAVAARPRVLVVDAAPRWEWRAALRALSADPGLEVRGRLLEADAGFVDFVDGRGLGGDFPDAEALRDVDVLVLGDVDSAVRGRLPTDWHRLVRAWVEAGGGLVLLGMSPAWLADSCLAELTPVALPADGPLDVLAGDASFSISLTPLGSVALPLDLDLEVSDLRWAAVDGPWRLDRAVAREPGQPLLTAGGRPLLTVTPAGAGTLVWSGTDEAWRWREAAARVHRRLVRLAARRALLRDPVERDEAFVAAVGRLDGLGGSVDVSTSPRLARRLEQLAGVTRRGEARLADRVRAEHEQEGAVDGRRLWPLAALARALEEAEGEVARLERWEPYRHAATADRPACELVQAELLRLDVALHLEQARAAVLGARWLAALDLLRAARVDLEGLLARLEAG